MSAMPEPLSAARTAPADVSAPSGAHSWTPSADEHPALPLTWQVHPGVAAVPRAPRHLRLVGVEAGEPDIPAPPSDWVARIARAVSEVGLGIRPAAQLTRWVRRDTLAWLAGRGIAYQRHPSTRAANARQGGVRPMTQVRAVRVCPVGPGAVECSAVLVGGGRARAIALRFEQQATHWIVTAITLG